MKCVLLDYLFMFEPDKTWQHRYQFEADLTKFLSEKGLTASVMPYIEGGTGPRIIHIEKTVEPIQESLLKETKKFNVQDNLQRLKSENKIVAKDKTGKKVK